MTRFLAAQLAHTHYLSIAKAKQDFGYVPLVSMAEGMKRLQCADLPVHGVSRETKEQNRVK